MTEIAPRFYRGLDDSWLHRTVARLDWGLFFAALGLSVMSLFWVFSATSQGGHGHSYLVRQMAALAVGVAGMTFLVILPYQVLQTYWRWIFGLSLVALVMVLLFGVRMRGSRSWFHFHWFYFQPVEVTRLALAVALAGYADVRFRDLREWSGLAVPFGMTALHLGLVLMQPDLSSVIVLVPMTLAMLYAAGAPGGVLLSLTMMGGLAVGIPLASTYFRFAGARFQDSWILSTVSRAFLEPRMFFQFWGAVCAGLCAGWWFLRRWRVAVPGAMLVVALAVVTAGVAGSFVVKGALKDYQRRRLIAFVDPNIDPLAAGYNILQSEIAIGSGRFFGKGFLAGSQTQLGFLPEKHTDFIFSLLAEERGFFGAIVVLGLYFFIVWRAFDIAVTARDRFGRFLAVGLGTLLGFMGLVNIGMVMGLMPVTGLPLPFLSYGGSAMVGAYLALGLLLSVHLRRYIL